MCVFMLTHIYVYGTGVVGVNVELELPGDFPCVLVYN